MMQALFTVLSFKRNICCSLNSTDTPFMSLNSQRIKKSHNIKNIFVDEKILIWVVGHMKNNLSTYSF